MPTGYTDKIYSNVPITFAEFVWTCARTMGALYHLRDDAMGVPRLDAALQVDWGDAKHHEDELASAETALARLEAMGPADMAAEMAERHRRSVAEHEESSRRSADLRARYAAMLEQVSAWTPPTDDHAGLRDFMVEQLETSMRHDCYDREPPAEPCLDEYRRSVLEHARWKVDYHRDALASARERTAGRLAWVQALDANVPCPRR